jgi:hypothetical protein
VATSGANALLHAGHALPTALTGGFHQAFWVLGAIALIAPPAVLVLTRRARPTDAAATAMAGEAQPAVATAN